MHGKIGDYALLGDTQTAALVSRGGSIDWMCLPRFDSPACFAAILGGSEHGYWRLAPETASAARRCYRGDTLVLETDYEGPEGAVTVVDAMPPADDGTVRLVRQVIGRGGRVPMRMELVPRFGYGLHTPRLERSGPDLLAVCGLHALRVAGPVPVTVRDGAATASFTVTGRQRVPFMATWHLAHQPPPPPAVPEDLIGACERWWRAWADRCTYQGEWRPAVIRSLLTLKALTYGASGGMVAAPTTALPEAIGGTRNWDYRYRSVRQCAGLQAGGEGGRA
jgi:GH15 family glucan-1,4-alpha-glucosidase